MCDEDDVFGGPGHIVEKVNDLDEEGSKSASCASNSMHNGFFGRKCGHNNGFVFFWFNAGKNVIGLKWSRLLSEKNRSVHKRSDVQ